MKLKNYFALMICFILTANLTAQVDQPVPNEPQSPNWVGTFDSMVYVPSIASRKAELTQPDMTPREAQDKRSLRPQVVIGKDPQNWDDYLAANPHPSSQSVRSAPPFLVFDAYTGTSSPTDPSMAVGPNHVIVTWNTAFAIYDKNGNVLQGPTAPNPAIFPGGGCCDLTVSYDDAADRWVLTFLGASQSIAVSDGPDPINDGWNVYGQSFNDYQKLSIWSDGYYMTQNTQGSQKIFALERDAMLAGDPGAQIATFNLPGVAGTTPFFSPQFLSVTDGNMPATGGATVVFLQDDAFGGIATDHVKYWTVDMDWGTIGNSTISAATEISVAPFISVFDGGSFDNLAQPGGGSDIDAVQNTVMNQAQFRKFPGHNSALFTFVVDTDASAGERAGVRWMEWRQPGDNQPWSLYQEGTFTSPDGKHAWMGSMIMDNNGNIALGYSAMAGPTTPNPTNFRVGSYYTGRFDGDALGTMTVIEEEIGVSSNNVPNLRYCDYNKMDIDPSNDDTFWFINEYMTSGTGRSGIVGVFQITPPQPNDIGMVSIDEPVNGVLTATEDIVVSIRNFGSNDIVNPEIQYTIDGGTPVVETYSGTIVAGTVEQYTFAQTADLSAPGSYLIEAKTNLAGDSNTSNDTASKTVVNGLIYCQPSADCSFGDGFQLISIEQINNPSGCEGYGDFTNQVANLDPDTTYDLTVTTGYGDQFVSAWIDFNDDGTFTADELVVDNYEIADGQGSGSYTETFDLVVPAGAALGEHRMRFKSNWDAPVPPDACATTQFGETEDYTAQIGELSIQDRELANSDLIVVTKPNSQYEISLITGFDGIASIRIYNQLGQTLAFNNLEKKGDRYVYNLDMSYASAGVYFIQMGDQSSRSYKTAKIIVN
ncbi:T9SS type A sorting domain-containing protein [Aureitalea sp. L0-47]|uniref:T9SS type A sorting domain-containing protein n=1 Tax=Aureitalea sp. L0-47 TaxID=2816962 RepID=UPI002238E018|nr:T9SS type A sorting domain-containing protein [Aureitalea sp. L0-47]MCW5518348.1 T9SS type A sorting domain-containing protein [Aureitalea sp. L0-47]